MWSGAKDFSEGVFHVPRYYGQDYNTMMEALVAVPLIKCHIPIYYAVPIATHFLFLFPFLFTAFFLFFKSKKAEAIIVLAVLLCMPVGYDIINSIPRGFVTGLFFTSFFVINLCQPKNYLFIGLNTFFACAGYLVNPNSILVSAPFLGYLLLVNYRNKYYYACSFFALLLALPLHYSLDYFYKLHPEYILYGFNNTYSFEFFKAAVSHLDQRFAHIGFFLEESCIPVLAALTILIILLYRNNKKAFFSFLLLLIILLFSFFSSKVNDGLMWPFYSYSRMYLGFPIIFYLFLLITDLNFKKWAAILIPVVLLFVVYKEVNFKKTIAYHVQEKMWGHVELTSLKEIKRTLNIYKNFSDRYGVTDFIIVNHVWKDDLINYAGPAILDDFPHTFKPSFERRTWRIFEERELVHSKFLIYTNDYRFDEYIKKNYSSIDIMKVDDYGLFLIKHNKLKTLDFIHYIGAKTDGF